MVPYVCVCVKVCMCVHACEETLEEPKNEEPCEESLNDQLERYLKHLKNHWELPSKTTWRISEEYLRNLWEPLCELGEGPGSLCRLLATLKSNL